MKTAKWVGLLSIAAMPWYSGCAQAPGQGYPTTVVSSGPSSDAAPVAQPPDASPPAEASTSFAGGPPPPPGGAQPPVDATAAQMQSSASVPAEISPAAADMMKLAESGVSDDVLIAYAKKSPTRYDLSPDTIIYLKDLGISSEVITAMIDRDAQLPPDTAEAQPPAPAEPAPASQPSATPPVVTGPLVTPDYVTTAPPDVNYFYDDLSPYGTWLDLDGVGWCWQPRCVVVNRTWSPYCDAGQWVYTDCGWFWQSDYSWGWAPFHYGRWYHHDRCGWVWTPDRVWGPAWVTWRVAGDSCGWAPLPPHAIFDARLGWTFNGLRVGATFDFGLRPDRFTFIAMRDFHRHDFPRVRMPLSHARGIYAHATVVNSSGFSGHTIVNRGVPADRISAVTHVPIHRVSIHEAPAGHRPSGGSTHGVVYRHDVRPPSRPIRAVAQKIDARHPVVEHTAFKPVAVPHNNSGRNTFATGAFGTRTQTPGHAVNGNASSNSRRTAVPHQSLETRSAAPSPSTTQRSGRTVTPPLSSSWRNSNRQPAQRETPRAEQSHVPPVSRGQDFSRGSRTEVPRQYDAPRASESPRHFSSPHEFSSGNSRESRSYSPPSRNSFNSDRSSRSESRSDFRSESRGDNGGGGGGGGGRRGRN